MSIPKVLGIETEYGIAGGPDLDPIVSSSIIVNAYAQHGRTRINWDFEGETPDMDARGLPGLTSVRAHRRDPPRQHRAHQRRAALRRPRPPGVLVARVPHAARGHALRLRRRGGHAPSPDGGQRDPRSHQAITLYKNNSDGKGNSYGCHENYLVAATSSSPHRARHGAALRLSPDRHRRRQGRRRDRARTGEGPGFQLSQRAEFFEEVVGLETTLKRPIINTRDEPHSDAERFRRLHVIIGDANMSQVATFVKLGATSFLLAALEDMGADGLPQRCRANPVQAVRAFSLDPTLEATTLCDDDQKRSAWDFQDELWHLANTYVERDGAAAWPRPTRSPRSSPSGARCSTACATTQQRSPTESTGWPRSAS
jgi:Pup amidohydrolase